MLLLKEGEEEKRKIYSALCIVGKTLTEGDINKLNNMVDIKLSQKTPVRVLHRLEIFFAYCIDTKVNQYCILLLLIIIIFKINSFFVYLIAVSRI